MYRITDQATGRQLRMRYEGHEVAGARWVDEGDLYEDCAAALDAIEAVGLWTAYEDEDVVITEA